MERANGPVITKRALAKVNLVLRVGRQRDDGYHEIDSLMHTIALGDDISVSLDRDINLFCTDPHLPTGPDNLAYRAAILLQRACGTAGSVAGATIRIRKRIPVAAGLGGGSTDAAAVLSLLNKVWGCNLSADELHELALQLGADVPFCLVGGAARATGIGERLESVAALPGVAIVLISWPSGLSTAEVYRAFAKQRPESTARVAPAVASLRSGDLRALGAAMANDLQPIVDQMWPEARQARADLLSLGALGAVVTGSGPTVCGLFADNGKAGSAAQRLASRWPRVILTELAAKGLGSARANTRARGDR